MGIKYVLLSLLLVLSAVTKAQNNSLDYYLQKGIENSPLLRDYQLQLASNSIDSERIRAQYRPQVTASSNNSYAPVINGFGYDNAITNGAQVSGIVTMEQTILTRGNLTAQYGTIRLQNQRINNSVKLTEQDLRRTITNQFLTAFGDLQQLTLANEVHDLLSKELTILKTLTEQNVYRQTDYLTLLVTAQQQDLALRQLNIQFHSDFATLNYMAGIIDTTTVDLIEPAFTLERTIPEQDKSIFFRQFLIDSLQINQDRLLVDYSYKPKINVYANAGYLSSFSYEAYKNFGTSVGLNVTIPIYDGHQKQMQYKKLEISERSRSNYKSFYAGQYYQQIYQLEQQLNQTEALIDNINNQIKYTDGLIKVNTKLLETGDAKIADLIIALNNYLMAKNLLTQNTVNRLQIINQINYWNR